MIKLTLYYLHSTPEMYRYEPDGYKLEINSLYIKRFAFPDGPPQTITVTIEEGHEDPDR